MLPREYRLTSPADYRRVRSEGRSWANGLLVISRAPNGLPVSRFGISVSRRLGGAVRRNRVKRLLRESVRRQLDIIRPGWDVVLIARKGIVGKDLPSVDRALSELLGRAQVYRPSGRVGGKGA